MVYKPSTAKFAGRTKTYFIIYKISQKLVNGKKQLRTKVKRVYISGKLKSWARGTFPSRFGSRIHGIKFTYVNPIKGGAGRLHRIKSMRITKLVDIPENARDVRVSSRAPKGPMLDIS